MSPTLYPTRPTAPQKFTLEMRREEEALRSKPAAPAAPIAPPLWIEPPWTDVVKQSEVNGCDVEKARHECVAVFTGKLEWLHGIVPAAVASILAHRTTIRAASELYHEEITEAFQAAKAVEQNLISREATLREIAAQRASYDEALRMKDDPASLHLSGENLMIFESRRKFLPASLAALENTLMQLEDDIARIAKEHAIDIAALLKNMAARARSPRGGIADEALHAAAKIGWPTA
jgi:hypothetical protein